MDKLSDSNNEVKYLLVCVDLFSRFVRVQPMKSKYSTDAVAAFKKMLRKKSMPAKVWVDQGTGFSGEFRKFCTDKKIKIYSTRSETKAAVAERAIKSLKNIFYRYMEENGYQKKIFHSEKVINLSSQMKYSKLLKLLLLNHKPITFVENKVMKF